MMDRIDPRLLLGGVLFAILSGFITYYFVFIRPVDLKADSLRKSLDNIVQERAVYTHQLQDKKNRYATVDDEIARLRLFDLRGEEAFDTVLANRSNVGLIALSEILQRNGITVDSLTPGPIDQTIIGDQQSSQGGVLHRHYLIHAQGRYEDVQTAFSAFKTLPPALDIDHYDIQYIGYTGDHARVYFELGFAFNFLVSQKQLAKFSDLASSSFDATPSIIFLDPGAASTSAKAASGSLVLPAVPVSTGSDRESLGQHDGWHALADLLEAPADMLVPPAYAMPKPAAGPKPAGKAPAAAIRAYTFSVDKGISLGRAEPFLPLGEARQARVVIQKSLLTSIKPALPLPDTSLLAVLLSNDGPATALIQFGNERMRVRPGSVLSGGAQVAAIGRDFVLIRFEGALHRVGLRSDAGPAIFAPAPAQSMPEIQSSKLAPAPGLPMVPSLPVPGKLSQDPRSRR